MTQESFASSLPKCSSCHLPILEDNSLKIYISKGFEFPIHSCGHSEGGCYYYSDIPDSTDYNEGMYEYISSRIDHIDT
jgi:hypothetical protein